MAKEILKAGERKKKNDLLEKFGKDHSLRTPPCSQSRNRQSTWYFEREREVWKAGARKKENDREKIILTEIHHVAVTKLDKDHAKS